jgi:hypothetical protein
MWQTIRRSSAHSPRSAFTIVEAMLSSIIVSIIMLAVWGVYMMGWQWWGETGPRLDLEKAARMALLSVIEGSIDQNAGTYTVGSTTYTRRNGIAWSTQYPTISSDKKTISYRLEPDSSNARQFYYGTYNGDGYIFYRNGSGAVTRLDSTKGVTGIQFSQYVDAGGTMHNNIIQVAVTSEKDIYGTRKANPYHVQVVYTDTVLLRNAL